VTAAMPKQSFNNIIPHTQFHPAVANNESAQDLAKARYQAQLDSASKRFKSSLIFGKSAAEISMADIVDDDIQQLPRNSFDDGLGVGSTTLSLKVDMDKIKKQQNGCGCSSREMYGRSCSPNSCRNMSSFRSNNIAPASVNDSATDMTKIDKDQRQDKSIAQFSISTIVTSDANKQANTSQQENRTSRLKRLPVARSATGSAKEKAHAARESETQAGPDGTTFAMYTVLFCFCAAESIV
jgi:hypothetical protein